MPTYRVNADAVAQARELVDDGQVDVDTEWSDAAPSADGNAEVEANGCSGYAGWHLAVDPDASGDTKGRYRFPYGALRHREIEEAFGELLDRLDAKRS